MPKPPARSRTKLMAWRLARTSYSLSVPGLRALRWSSDELYVGMKETYTITRVEAGRSSFFTRGKLWSSAPWLAPDSGAWRRRARPLARRPDGVSDRRLPAARRGERDRQGSRCILISRRATRAARAFQRLHDAVQAGAGRLALEVAVAEAISAFAAIGGASCEHTRAGAPRDRAPSRAPRRRGDARRARRPCGDGQVPLVPRLPSAKSGCHRMPTSRGCGSCARRSCCAAGVKPSEVAPRVGLCDQSQLNRHFRRIVGTTPGAYARDLQFFSYMAQTSIRPSSPRKSCLPTLTPACRSSRRPSRRENRSSGSDGRSGSRWRAGAPCPRRRVT